MAFKMKIQEISIKTQSVEKFSKDLQSISAGILNGTAVWWKNCHGAQMLSGLQDILVECEFAFFGSHNVYVGKGVKRISWEKENVNPNASDPENQKEDVDLNSSDTDNQLEAADQKDSVQMKLKTMPMGALFVLPWLLDPILLPLALTMDWSANQRSLKNEKLLQRKNLQYTSSPGRTRRVECASDDSAKEAEKDSQRILKSFGKISGWCGRKWNYFPVFFVLAFLTLSNCELRLLKKTLESGNRGYNEVKDQELEELEALCGRISSLANQENLRETTDLNTPSSKTKEQLMREYIAMSAFMSMICKCENENSAIENLLLLDNLTGLCTALLGCQTMEDVLTIWKECKQDKKKADFEILLRKMKRTLLYIRDYSEDNIINKMENEDGSYYMDKISQATRKCQEIIKCPIRSDSQKLAELIILQFKEIDRFSVNLSPVVWTEKLLQAQNNSKKEALDLYFSAQTSISQKQFKHIDFDNIIEQFIKGLRAVESALKSYETDDNQKEFSTKKTASSKVEHISEKKIIPVSVEEQDEIYRYKTLQSIWMKFFLVRRMQNGEPPIILFSLGDPKKTILEHMKDEHRRLSSDAEKSSSEAEYLKTLDDMLQIANNCPEYKDYLDRYILDQETEAIAAWILEDVAQHYPTELWPYPETILSLQMIREELSTPPKDALPKKKTIKKESPSD